LTLRRGFGPASLAAAFGAACLVALSGTMSMRPMSRNAGFVGSTGGVALNRPVVGMASAS
jgi:hypothetical protein